MTRKNSLKMPSYETYPDEKKIRLTRKGSGQSYAQSHAQD